MLPVFLVILSKIGDNFKFYLVFAFICHQILIFIFSFCTSYVALKLFRFFSRFKKKVKLLCGKLQNCCCCPFKNVFFWNSEVYYFPKSSKIVNVKFGKSFEFRSIWQRKKRQNPKIQVIRHILQFTIHISSITTQIRTRVTIFWLLRAAGQ